MKIYNRKTFAFGLFAAFLCLLNLITGFYTGFDLSNGLLIAALLFCGGGALIRGCSKQLSKEDKLDALDERNQLVALKSQSKALRLTQSSAFLLMLLCLIAGKVSDYTPFMGIAIGLAVTFSISLFAEIATYIYYEEHC